MKHWPTKPLGEVLEVSRERIEPLEHPDATFNYVGLENIEGHTGNLLHERISSPEHQTLRRFSAAPERLSVLGQGGGIPACDVARRTACPWPVVDTNWVKRWSIKRLKNSHSSSVQSIPRWYRT